MKVAALMAGLLSGLIGAMGLGGGAVLLIYLTVFANTEQIKAQGINLMFFIPIALLAVVIYAAKGQIEHRVVLPLAAGGAFGAAAGIFLADFIGGRITSVIFGVLLVLLGIKEILSKKQNKS